MEGKSSSCTHFSPLGNIAGAAADLWSNESVQNIQLLNRTAPEAYLELLAYDCRLFNTSIKAGESLKLRNWLVESDVENSVEALMLEPEAVIKIAQAIVKENSGYLRTKAAVETAFELISRNTSSGRINLSDVEKQWLDKIQVEIESLPESEDEAIEQVSGLYGNMFLREAYGL